MVIPMLQLLLTRKDLTCAMHHTPISGLLIRRRIGRWNTPAGLTSCMTKKAITEKRKAIWGKSAHRKCCIVKDNGIDNGVFMVHAKIQCGGYFMKRDYKKILKDLYLPIAHMPTIVMVPELHYVMVSGAGLPQEESFQSAAQTLYPVAYVIKFMIKEERPEEDFVVMPMEVKWRLDRAAHGSDRYYWTMMIMQPECVSKAHVEKAIDTLKSKKKNLPYADRLRFRSFTENLCGEILHIGPYKETMEVTFRLLKQELTLQGYDWEPDSHDVYFNDIRRTPAEKLKTLMRVRIWKKGTSPGEMDDPFLS